MSKFDAQGGLIGNWGNNGSSETPNGQLSGTNATPTFNVYKTVEGPFGTPFSGMAVDPAGNLWVFDHNEAMFEFGRSSTFINSWYAGSSAHPGGLAVDEGNIYLDGGFERAVELTTHEANQGLLIGGGYLTRTEIHDLSFDPSSGDLFIDANGSVQRIHPSSCNPGVGACAVEETFGASQLLGGEALAVNSATGTVVVAEPGQNRIAIFTPEVPERPAIVDQSISSITANSATFSASINPLGRATEYHFEYGPTAAYGQFAPVPDKVVGSGFSAQEVNVHTQGLVAGTTYHYRVVAHNTLGTSYGEDKTFTTQAVVEVGGLPDGREWELVTPAQKQGALFYGLNLGFYSNGASPLVTKASSDGAAVVNLASSPTEAEPQGSGEYASVLSTRTSEGWSSRVITVPHEEGTGPSVGKGGEYAFFSEDLSQGILSVFGNFDRQLSPEATEATPYLRTNYFNGNLGELCETSCYRPLVTASNTRSGAVFGEETNGHCEDVLCGPRVIDATPDASHVVFSSPAQLTAVPDEEGYDKSAAGALYEWSNGRLQPLYLLPENEGGGGVFAGELATVGNQLSEKGSVFFSYAGHLYLHNFDKGPSTRLDVAQGTQEPSEAGAAFLYASTDGSKVLFSDPQQLTSAPGGGVYECRIVEMAARESCELTLTDVPESSLIGGSDDASLLYFMGAGEKLEVARYSEGTWKVSAGPLMGSQPVSTMPTYRVSPNGRYLTFMTDSDLTGYDTRDALSGQPDQEVYLYDAYSDTLRCASCDPTGARPVGVEDRGMMLVAGSVNEGVPIAASLPPWVAIKFELYRYQPRFLSDSGRLFFNSSDALTPKDVDGTEDVYEYEPPGVGTCEASSTTYSASSGGCVSLISSGSSPEESAFMDASESGSDVFFMTQTKLLPQDFDNALDVYDAHECNPSAPCYAPPAVSPPPCSTGDSCKAAPTPQPSAFGAPPSATFSGAGNIAQPTPAEVAKKALTKPQKLAQALHACKKKKHKARATCEQKARRLYGTTKTRKARAKHKGKR
ncbi:MAG TPA: hypothetical protein VIJ39_02885 [Solirubrobacteraceae bacterium]